MKTTLSSLGMLGRLLAPLVFAGAAFLASRAGALWRLEVHEKHAAELARPPRDPDAGEILRVATNDLHGLERRRALVTLESTPSLAALQRLRDSGKSDGDYPAEIIANCANNDPEATWRFLSESPGPASTRQTTVVLDVWLRKDPDALAKMLKMTPDSEDRAVIAFSALNAIAEDREGVADAAMKHFDLLVSQDPDLGSRLDLDRLGRARVLTRVLTLPPSPGRDQFWSGVAERWLASDWLNAVSWVETLPTDSGTRIEAGIADTAFRSRNPDDALLAAWASKWLSRNASSGDVARLGPTYVETLARTNPETAYAWASARLSGQPLARALGAIAAIRFTSDPDEARDMVAALPTGGTQQAAAARVAAAWGRRDPVAAIAWWLEFPHDSLGPDEFTRFADVWSKSQLAAFRLFATAPETPALPARLTALAVDPQNPAATIDLVETSDGPNRDRLLNQAVFDWAQSEPAAIAARLSANPDLISPARVRTVAMNWYAADRQATIEWVDGLPDDAARLAAADFVRSKVSADPQLTLNQKRSLLAKLP